jgi:hypothetical protein
VATFLLIVIGYGSGFWRLSSGAEQVQPSPSPAAIVIEHRGGLTGPRRILAYT